VFVSIELTNRCQKACWFCYNHSQPAGEEVWTADELVRFIVDCCEHGTKAVSFGGGEPLQSPLLLPLLKALAGRLFRSLTTNGLLLEGQLLEALVQARPDKVHLSIHFPENQRELHRVMEQVQSLASRGIRSGVNLLVARSNLPAATQAAQQLRSVGIGNERIVYLPMRGQDTPSPAEVAAVAPANRANMAHTAASREQAVFMESRIPGPGMKVGPFSATNSVGARVARCLGFAKAKPPPAPFHPSVVLH
jgi:molybdenum cofactor biosynthesis enzyme MoaA